MTGTALVLTILLGTVKILLTCLPTGAVNKLIDRFEMHGKLNGDKAAVFKANKEMEGQEKRTFIEQFNASTVLKKYYVFPGNEPLFLNRKDSGEPIRIETTRGRKKQTIFVFPYQSHVDVVRQSKKEVIAYSVRSKTLQLNG